MKETELRIGEVASRTGVSIDTLRYYEKRRLLGRAKRSSGGFRLFAHEAVERVLFIKQAQQLGFSLAEIGELLASKSNEAFPSCFDETSCGLRGRTKTTW